MSGTREVRHLRELQALQADEDLAAELAAAEPDPPFRRGVVLSVQAGPKYTVAQAGTTIPGLLCAGGFGPMPGDQVLLTRNRGDWLITGVLPAGPRTWTPQLVGSTTTPALGNGTAQGSYRMLGPTSMWLQFSITLGSTSGAGSGLIGVAGLPLVPAAEQVLPAVLYAGGSRYAAAGVVNAGSTTVPRFAAQGGGGLGVTFAAPGSFGNGATLTGTGVLEVGYP